MTTSSHAQFLRELRSLLRSPYPLIHLETYEEERALKLLRDLAGADGRPLRTWSAVTGFDGKPAEAGFDEALRAIGQAGEPAIFVLKDAQGFLDDPASRRRLRELAGPATTSQKTVVFLGPAAPAAGELQKDIVRLAMPLPGREVIARECEVVFPPDQYPDLARDSLVSGAMGLTAKEAFRAFHRVRQQLAEARERNQPFDVEQSVLREKQRLIAQSHVLEFHPLDEGLGEVGGLHNLKRWLDERREAFGQRARTFGLPAPKGLLLLGVQGCGKSLTAKAIGRHWGLPLLRLDLGAVFDGSASPEESLRRALRTCEAVAPCVLWIDEIEKGFSGEGDGRTARVIGSLLTWQQEKTTPVFLVATANDVEDLPPEMLRKGRFDEIFFIDLPDIHERRQILDIHLARRGRYFDEGIVDEIAGRTEYFSGAELEQVVVSAMYTAFADGRDIAREDLVYACKETVPLYRTYEEHIKRLREWAHGRARPASHERKVLDFFEPQFGSE